MDVSSQESPPTTGEQDASYALYHNHAFRLASADKDT